ncbi:MAG: hypothetical protein U0930_05120 [Pirellulales bacterium]
MTLPSRRKRQITAPSIQLASQIKHSLRASLVGFVSLGLSCCLETAWVTAQDWQPTRLPADSSAQPLPASGAVRMSTPSDEANRPVLSSNQQLGSGMVLRWRSTAPRGAQPLDNRDQVAAAPQANYRAASNSANIEFASSPTIRSSTAASSQVSSSGGYADNNQPNALRSNSSGRSFEMDNPVRQAAYQDASSPQWRSVNTRRQDEAPQLNQVPQQLPPNFGNAQNPGPGQLLNPGFQDAPQLNPPQLDKPSANAPQIDLLDQPEAAPMPPAGQTDPPSFPRTLNEDNSPADGRRSDNNRLRDSQTDVPRRNPDDLDQLLKQARKSSTPNCETQRDLLRGQPLSSLNLNVAPRLSNGIREDVDAVEAEKMQEEFQQRAIRRDWTDYKGSKLASGRMKELRYGNVVIDVDGTEQLLPLNSLSDVDMSYIADLWNLPFRCGSGYDPLVGREFIASTVQWKASGACHNPLYFEQVQLERYGHDAGPIAQPLLSSAHFFLTIPILPYKMGINPMNECQYALGYYRPGNCAPYMMQPIPLSLRGGLAQTGAVLGMAAALP